jgi:hypothetical protein
MLLEINSKNDNLLKISYFYSMNLVFKNTFSVERLKICVSDNGQKMKCRESRDLFQVSTRRSNCHYPSSSSHVRKYKR